MDTLPFSIYKKADLIARIGEFKRFRPQNPSLLYVTKGQLSLVTNGAGREYVSNNVIFISQKNAYEFKSLPEDTELFMTDINLKQYKHLRFNFNRVEVYRAVSFERNCIAVPEDYFSSTILPLLELIYRQSHETIFIKYKIEILTQLFGALIYTFVNQVEKEIYSNLTETSSRKKQLAFDFLELISNEYIREKKLKYYADKLNVSIKYLSISVKGITGHSPTYLLADLLLKEAHNKLSDEKQKIANIADDLNFADMHSFSKFFRKHSGMSPSRFRKEIKQVHSI